MDLREYLFFERKTIKSFSEQLGIGRSYLSQIIHGKKKAGNSLRKNIETITGGKVKADEIRKNE